MARKKKVDEEVTLGTDFNDEELINSIMSEVNKITKSDTVMVGDNATDANVPYWILTGIPALDYAVGGYNHPGFPGGRVIEVYGAEGSGKSTMAVWLMKKSIDQVKAVAYYQDAERVLTPEIIKGTGINMALVMREQPDTIEAAFDNQRIALDAIAKKCPNKPVVTILDSVAACPTQAEIDGDTAQNYMGVLARAMSKGLKTVVPLVNKTAVLSIFVNQIRDKIGVMFGDNTTTSGGRALAFYASVRIQLARTSYIKDGDTVIGGTYRATIKKNKVAPPLQKAEFQIDYIQSANGSYPRINTEMAVLDWLEANGLVEGKAGRLVIDGKNLYKKEWVKRMVEDAELTKRLTELAYSVKLEAEPQESEEIEEEPITDNIDDEYSDDE